MHEELDIKDRALATQPSSHLLDQLGQSANAAARRHLFADERAKKAPRTILRHDDDLDSFARFLRAIAQLPDPPPYPDGTPPPNPLASTAEAWAGVTWGLLKAFGAWLVQGGYAMASVNSRLATVRLYARWAAQAGIIPAEELLLIQGVSGFDRKAAYNIDQQRPVTRIGDKKATSRVLTPAEVRALKDQPDTPQGRRDAVLIHILLDHGLRCGELAMLRSEQIDRERGTLTFYRPKVYLTQTHQLTWATRRALTAYLDLDAGVDGPLLLASRKGGALTHKGMSARAITARVADLGKLAGIHGLSAHDLRHTWATLAARNGTPLERLQDAGGWNSPAMPLRYIESARIANDGVRLGLDDERSG